MNKVEVKTSGTEINVSIQGEITAETKLPNIAEPGAEKIIFKFSGINYINSGGVRSWVLWLGQAKSSIPNAQIFFENMPPNFVKQAASIRDFLPKGSQVKSLILPYYCDNCSHNSETQVTWGVELDVKKDNKTLASEIAHRKCPQCGEKAELDGFPEQFIQTKPKL